MSETRDRRHDRIFETLSDMWDFQALIKLFDAEYQRGRDDYRDELLASLDKREVLPTRSQPVNAPVQSSPPARRTAPSPRAEGTNPPRPPGIPTTFAMIREVLQDNPAGLTMAQVAERIAEKYWPGLQGKFIGPDVSTSITKGRLRRDENGRLTLTVAGLEVESVDTRIVRKGSQPEQPIAGTPAVIIEEPEISDDGVLPEEPSRVPMPPVKPTGGERPPTPPLTEGMVVKGGHNPGDSQIKERPPAPGPIVYRPPPLNSNGAEPKKQFTHDGKSVMLYPKEHAVVSRLKVGAGFLPFGLLIDTAFVKPERPPADPAAWLRDVEPLINSKIETIGLQLKLVPKMGYALRKTDQ